MIDRPEDAPPATETFRDLTPDAQHIPAMFDRFTVKLRETRNTMPGRDDYIIDPHGGTCNGDHNIVVSHFRQRPYGSGLESINVSWAASLFLSFDGAVEFTVGLMLATAMMEQLHDGAPMSVGTAMLLVETRLSRPV